MKFTSWIKTHKVWAVSGTIIIILVVAVTTITLANKGDNALHSSQLTATAEAPRPEPSPSSTPDPTPTLTATATPLVKATATPATPKPQATATPASAATQSGNATITWSYNGSSWQPSSTAPSCPAPFTFTSPVDLSLATSILYPGQTRGGDYKPHGGFRFDNSSDGIITVRAPYSGYITQASRYIENGVVQYLFDFQHSCGISWRFDHLTTLSSSLQAIAETLPAAQANDSRTTPINPPVSINAGQTLGTKIGHPDNTFLDWGVYDLRTNNGITKSNNSLASYGVCWFDWLSSSDEATVRGLPATAGNTTSDYCN